MLLGWDERYLDGSAYLDGAAGDDDDDDDGDSSTAAAAFRRCVALHARQAGAVRDSVNRAAEVEIFMGGDFFF